MDDSTAQGFPVTTRFRLARTLGSGGMGIVFEATDLDRHARVAIKTLRNLDPQSLYRLKREFRSLQDLHHPNLVTLGELIEAEGQWFFTMELVRGVDFLTYVRGGGPGDDAGGAADSVTRAGLAPTAQMTPPTLVSATGPAGGGAAAPAGPEPPPGAIPFDEQRLRSALAQLCRGLAALHEAGKVHRDIKPSNVHVAADGRVVLLDFGLVCQSSDPRQSTAEAVVGTAAYMAPEQAAAKLVGPAADWYSVGALLYEALTGQLPFSGSAVAMLLHKQVNEPRPPHEIASGIPPDLDDLCVALLRCRPEARPAGDEILARVAPRAGAAVVPRASPPSVSGSPRFVGREAELAELRAAFTATRGGEARAVYVCGESGIGKSALIRRFVDGLAAERDDVVVLAGRCHERESVPYKAVDGVVDALSQYLKRLPKAQAARLLPRGAAMLPLIFPVLARVESVAEAPRPPREVRDPLEQRNRVFAALRELLARLADRHPLVLVIDDLQWADLDSLQLLGEIMRPPEAPPLLLVASLRDAPDDVARALARIAGGSGRIELDRLSPEESRELAAHLLARADTRDAEVARSIADEARGHPLFIDELVHHAQVAPSGAAGPLRLAEAIWHRVAQLEPEPIRLLELIGLAGMPVRQEVICQAAEIPPEDGSRLLSLLRAANLVRAAGGRGGDTVEPYHHLVREAVLAHLDGDRRRHGHERLAVALESSGVADDSPEMIVHHLEAAGRVAQATARAEEAARMATRALAFDRAARLLRTALRLGQHAGAEAHELRFQLGVALGNAGRGQEAAQAYLEAAADADPTRRLECQRRAAEQFLICGHIEEGLTTLRRVLGEVGVSLAASPRRALASLLWGRALLRLRGLRWRSRHESEVAARDLTLVDIHQSVAHGLAMVDTIIGADFQTRGLRLALKTGETMRVTWALGLEAGFVATQGVKAVPRARSILTQVAALVENSGDPQLHALTTVAEGVATYYEGRFRKAAEILHQGEQELLDRTTGTTWALNSTRLFRLLAVRRQGDYEELRRSLEAYVYDAARRGDRYTETSFRQLFNDVWLAEDDPRRASLELEESTWLPPEGRFHIQHWYDVRARAEIAFYQGDGASSLDRWAELFRALERSMLLRVQDARADYLWMRARCYLLQAYAPARAGAALAAAEKLARRLEREGVGYTAAWGHLVRAGVAERRGRRAQALAFLAAAEETADEHGLGLFAAAARRRRGELAPAGGSEAAALVAAADGWLRGHGIRAPARMVAAVTPGLDAASPAPSDGT